MLRSPSRSSAPSSPVSPSRRRLGIAGVANLFIRMRRLEESAVGKQSHTVISSGEPITQPGIAEACMGNEKLSVEYIDHFVCMGGVNVAILLRATRSALLEHIEPLGANGIINESWECTLSGPKPVHNGAYKVQVRYMGDAVKVKSSAKDPRKPVALDKAKGIPGLMTIIKRGDDYSLDASPVHHHRQHKPQQTTLAH